MMVIAVWGAYDATMSTCEARVGVEATFSILWRPVSSWSLPCVRCHTRVDLDYNLWGVLLTEHALFFAALSTSEDVHQRLVVGSLFSDARGGLLRLKVLTRFVVVRELGHRDLNISHLLRPELLIAVIALIYRLAAICRLAQDWVTLWHNDTLELLRGLLDSWQGFDHVFFGRVIFLQDLLIIRNAGSFGDIRGGELFAEERIAISLVFSSYLCIDIATLPLREEFLWSAVAAARNQDL